MKKKYSSIIQTPFMNKFQEIIQNLQIDDKHILLENLISLTKQLEEEQINQISHKLNRVAKELDFIKLHKKKIELLTNREREILHFLAIGDNNPIVAKKLFISRRTVEQHRKNINKKLQVSCYRELLEFVYAFNFI